MTRRTLHPVLQRLLALVLTGMAIGVAASAILAPIAAAYNLRLDALARLARHDAIAAGAAPALRYAPLDLFSEHEDTSAASIALQVRLGEAFTASGLAPASVRPLAAESTGEGGAIVWFETILQGDVLALMLLLGELDKARPLILVRALNVQPEPSGQPGSALTVTLEIGQAWRPATGPAP